MAQGLLKVQGRIPLEQFWPKGESDADTTKVKVEVGTGAREDSMRHHSDSR